MNFILKPSPQQEAKEYVVKVNSGSGVIVSSLDPSVAYILTARHVLGKGKARIVRHDGTIIKEKKSYAYAQRGITKDIDCAIIEIEATEQLAYAPISLGGIDAGERCWMIGYPETKSEEALSDRCKIQDGVIGHGESHKFIMNASNGPAKVFINGFSGAGVFVVTQGKCELVGIETRFDEPSIDYAEQFGRLNCYTLSYYSELLVSKSRPSLAPYFMSCFSRICESIFDLNFARPDNQREIRGYLIDAAKDLIYNGLPKPFELLEKYKEAILVDSSDSRHLMDLRLWVSLLEFYFICGVLDFKSSVDDEYLTESMTTRAFLYSGSTGSWLGRLREILTFAHNNLCDNGVVVVSSPEASPRLTPNTDYLNGVITDIASPSPFSKQQLIDQGVFLKLESLKINHLVAMHGECLVEYESAYAGKKSIDFMNLFRLHYGKFISRAV